MVRRDGHGRLRQQDDGGPEQDAGRDGGEAWHATQVRHCILLYIAVFCIQIYICWADRLHLPVHSELAADARSASLSGHLP